MATNPSSTLVSHRQECASCGRDIETDYAAHDYEPHVYVIENDATLLQRLFGRDTEIYCDPCYTAGNIDFEGKNIISNGKYG